VSKIQKNQSDKKNRVKVDEQAVLEMAKSGKTDKEISEALQVSIRSIMRVRTKHNIRRPRGGARPGAGRPKKTASSDTTDVTIEKPAAASFPF
jgi:hypothetical protein